MMIKPSHIQTTCMAAMLTLALAAPTLALADDSPSPQSSPNKMSQQNQTAADEMNQQGEGSSQMTQSDKASSKMSQHDKTAAGKAQGRSSAPQDVQATLDRLLSAIENGDYEGFSAEGSEAFNKSNPKDRFDKFSKAIAPIMAKGYQTHYFGQLTKEQNAIYLWKLTLDGAPDDALIGTSYNEADELINISFR